MYYASRFIDLRETIYIGGTDSLYYYPFIEIGDDINIRFRFHITYFDGEQSKPFRVNLTNFNLKMEDPDFWRGDINFQLFQDAANDLAVLESLHTGESLAPHVAIQGHPLYTNFILILGVGIIILIMFTLSIRDTASFVEAIAALLFGIFGARQFMIPDVIQYTTVTDTIIFGLYLFIVLSIVFHLLQKLTSQVVQGEKYYRNPSSHKYHTVRCKYIDRSSISKYIIYQSEKAARLEGRSPCKYCLKE